MNPFKGDYWWNMDTNEVSIDGVVLTAKTEEDARNAYDALIKLKNEVFAGEAFKRAYHHWLANSP